MNDLETRLKSLRPLPAPPAILVRARRGRRPWLFALAATAAALAVTAYVVVSAPIPERRDPASDFRSMVDRLLRARTLDVEIHTKATIPFPNGTSRSVERETVLRLGEGNRLNVVLQERQPDNPTTDVRIELVSDGKRLSRRMFHKDQIVSKSEDDTPSDLHRRVVHWMMSTGDIHPVQSILDLPLRDLPDRVEPARVPEGFAQTHKAWTTSAGGFEMTLVYDPVKGVPVGRVRTVPHGGSTERFHEFHLNEPLDDNLFVLPK